MNVVPLFLGTSPEVQINDDDLIISFPSFGDKQSLTEPMVCIQHIPTGITVESSGIQNFAYPIHSKIFSYQSFIDWIVDISTNFYENVDLSSGLCVMSVLIKLLYYYNKYVFCLICW